MEKVKKILKVILFVLIMMLYPTIVFASSNSSSSSEGGTAIAILVGVAIIYGGPIIAFTIISSRKNKKNKEIEDKLNNALKCTKCGADIGVNQKFCTKCGKPIEAEIVNDSKDGSPIVLVDPTYLNKEKLLIRSIVKGEIESQGEDIKKISTGKINLKKNLTLAILGILTLFYAIMYFYNSSLFSCVCLEGITIAIYVIIMKKLNVVNVLAKYAKKNPNEEISKIVSDMRINKKNIIIPSFFKTIVILFVAVLIPCMVFTNPMIIYTEYGDGYAVSKYTRGLTGQSDEVTIPEIYNGKKVIAIEESAFENSNIKEIDLPDSIESIKSKAFYNCKFLENIIIPDKVTEIRASAFENCVNLRSVYLPEGIVDIRGSAFKNDIKLSSIYLPESLQYLGAGAFSHCRSLIEITIPENVTEINGQTFEYCTSLRTINMHDNIVSIHGETFIGDTRLNNVILPSKITEIRGNTFENCTSLTSIIIPEGVTRIGGHAFYGCSSLSYVSVPSTVREIGSSAFRMCTSLYNISIPRAAVVNERAFKESPTIVSYLY